MDPGDARGWNPIRSTKILCHGAGTTTLALKVMDVMDSGAPKTRVEYARPPMLVGEGEHRDASFVASPSASHPYTYDC